MSTGNESSNHHRTASINALSDKTESHVADSSTELDQNKLLAGLAVFAAALGIGGGMFGVKIGKRLADRFEDEQKQGNFSEVKPITGKQYWAAFRAVLQPDNSKETIESETSAAMKSSSSNEAVSAATSSVSTSNKDSNSFSSPLDQSSSASDPSKRKLRHKSFGITSSESNTSFVASSPSAQSSTSNSSATPQASSANKTNSLNQRTISAEEYRRAARTSSRALLYGTVLCLTGGVVITAVSAYMMDAKSIKDVTAKMQKYISTAQQGSMSKGGVLASIQETSEHIADSFRESAIGKLLKKETLKTRETAESLSKSDRSIEEEMMNLDADKREAVKFIMSAVKQDNDVSKSTVPPHTANNTYSSPHVENVATTTSDLTAYYALYGSIAAGVAGLIAYFIVKPRS
jgi:hypothetical protein